MRVVMPVSLRSHRVLHLSERYIYIEKNNNHPPQTTTGSLGMYPFGWRGSYCIRQVLYDLEPPLQLHLPQLLHAFLQMKLNLCFHALNPHGAFLHAVLASWSGLLPWPPPPSPCGPFGKAPFTIQLSHLTLLLPWRVTNHLGSHGTEGSSGVQNFSAKTRKIPTPHWEH